MYGKEYFNLIRPYADKNKKLVPIVRKILSYSPNKVLDVGCGHGFLVKRLLSREIDAVGIDLSEFAGSEIPDNFISHDATKKFPFSDKQFDVCVSSDFLEHLDENEIDFCLCEMHRVAKIVLAQVCCKKEKVANTHKTVKPIEWWKKKFPTTEFI
jgi:ubiquinone/menaquinone biosynthesis C-methylase UbiE